MKKPQRKSDIAIIDIDNKRRWVCFNSGPEMVELLKQFGYTSTARNNNWLEVDARYEFTDVVNYIKHLGKTLSPEPAKPTMNDIIRAVAAVHDAYYDECSTKEEEAVAELMNVYNQLLN